ncbi:GNAT family N-acetyltransferase [Caulobacter sp. BK020]|uniref:GNAT family N-acetyltransferase n=1 Tax=Caulobacter sp. BK020 TaxID=2512117 RepID=UPI00104585FD|nr:GNAT family N-acetyltransferase [Caulobacter sp. BK020]TCS18133.1 N-acetylglutamate synthase-like GNAT family acetyltransferase [Caulobacter sp. BK020]
MITLRGPRPGDYGWIVQRHGALYADEQGWDARFEGLVAGVVAELIKSFDPAREACWIAEHEGRRVGSILLVRESDTVGRLRLLLVEPSARGLGVGDRLVAECVTFARLAGYREVVLWTQSNLLPARRLYQRAGFVLEDSWPYEGFGEGLISETWRLRL